MKAIIPAAGLGTRLRPHTYSTPKMLIKIGQKPIIDYIIDILIECGIKEIVMILGPGGEKLQSHIKKNYQIKSSFYYQTEFKGLAHAISVASDELTDEPVLIVLGDTIFETDLHQTIKGKYSSIGVKKVDNPKKYGVVVLDDNSYITGFIEKPDKFVSNLAIVGVYFFKKGLELKNSIQHILDNNIKTKGEFQITDALQNMIDNGEKFTTFEIEEWHDCGNPQNLIGSNRFILKKFSNNPKFSGSTIIEPCFIPPKADIVHSMLGPYVTIGKGTRVINSIIKDSIIGENVRIENMVLKNSIIGDNASIKGKESSLNIGDSSVLDF